MNYTTKIINNTTFVDAKELSANLQIQHSKLLKILTGECINGIKSLGLFKEVQMLSKNPLKYFIPLSCENTYYISKEGLTLLMTRLNINNPNILKVIVKYLDILDKKSFSTPTDVKNREILNKLVKKYCFEKQLPFSLGWYHLEKELSTYLKTDIALKKTIYESKYSKISLPQYLQNQNLLQQAIYVMENLLRRIA